MADVRRFESVVLKPLLVLWIQRFCSRTPRSLWHKARRSFLPIVNKISWMMRGRAGVAQMRCGLFRCGLYLSLVASVRTSHAMLLIVNSWSACLLQGDASCLESKNDWRCISGLFRKTSRTFERCFAVLGSIMVMLIFAGLYDLTQGRGEEILASISLALVVPGVLWTHASTTTACNCLPSLVTLCKVENEEEDADYMGLAMFLSLSECGFFVWDTCVTVGLVQKFIYFTAAMAGTIGFQTGALNFQGSNLK